MNSLYQLTFTIFQSCLIYCNVFSLSLFLSLFLDDKSRKFPLSLFSTPVEFSNFHNHNLANGNRSVFSRGPYGHGCFYEGAVILNDYTVSSRQCYTILLLQSNSSLSVLIVFPPKKIFMDMLHLMPDLTKLRGVLGDAWEHIGEGISWLQFFSVVFQL